MIFAPTAAPLVAGSAALGVLLLVDWLWARRRRSVLDRVGPYVVPGMTVRVDTWSQVVTAVGAAVRRLLHRRDSSASVRGALAGAGLGAVAGVMLASAGASALVIAVLVGVGAAAGLWWAETARARARRERSAAIDAALPAVADLLALCSAAGHSPVVGLAHAARASSGPLAVELDVACAQMDVGVGLSAALGDMAERADHGGLRRLVDTLTVAVERGTPLADVLRTQADEIRASRRRQLMEQAGRREVAMLVPIVFLVLPAVVVIALYPAIQALHLVAS